MDPPIRLDNGQLNGSCCTVVLWTKCPRWTGCKGEEFSCRFYRITGVITPVGGPPCRLAHFISIQNRWKYTAWSGSKTRHSQMFLKISTNKSQQSTSVLSSKVNNSLFISYIFLLASIDSTTTRHVFLSRMSSALKNSTFSSCLIPGSLDRSSSTAWCLNQPLWKIWVTQIGNHLPQIFGVNIKKSLSCHQYFNRMP